MTGRLFIVAGAVIAIGAAAAGALYYAFPVLGIRGVHQRARRPVSRRDDRPGVRYPPYSKHGLERRIQAKFMP